MIYDNQVKECRYSNVCPESVTCGCTPEKHHPCYVYESRIDRFLGRLFNSEYDWNIYREYKSKNRK